MITFHRYSDIEVFIEDKEYNAYLTEQNIFKQSILGSNNFVLFVEVAHWLYKALYTKHFVIERFGYTQFSTCVIIK